MERQCRICLDTENPETMISPCMCRGTAAYIHEACFQQYLDHYPDRVCRVCHYRVPGTATFSLDAVVFLVMAFWMIALLMLSSVAEHYKVIYLFMLAGLLLFVNIADVFRGVFGICLLCVSFLFTFLEPTIAVQCVLFFGLLGIIGIMFLYIPPEIMLMFVAILLMGAYSILIVSFFALKQDMYLTAFIVPFMALVWACVIRARPPLRP
jgi:hypothetical protein